MKPIPIWMSKWINKIVQFQARATQNASQKSHFLMRILWFCAGGFNGPNLFGNFIGQAITVYDHHYKSMITNFFCPELDDLNNTKQDSATCRSIYAYDLIVLNCFLLSFFKSQPFVNKPQSQPNLKISIKSFTYCAI